LWTALWCLLGGSTSFAQTAQGTIAGVVRDTTGAVLPGVTVEASSPALIEKVRSAVTDGEGQYKIVELRPGVYNVTFTLPGFSTVRREGIELTTGFTANVPAELRVGEVSETITVTGESPVVDVQNTRQQVVMTRAVVDAIPSGRSYTNMAMLIPGTTAMGGAKPQYQDVGGQGGHNYLSIAVHGGRNFDQQLQIDSMPLVTFTRTDTVAIFLMDGNFQEYAVDYAGNAPEVDTGGVRINLIPKEGGNRFLGGLFANIAPPKLQGKNISDELRAQGLSEPGKLKALYQINPSVGGPILQDKLWFFGSFTYTRNEQYVAGQFLNANLAAWDYVPDLSRQAVGEQWARDGAVRITWQPSS
jgi:hypothetical protein